MVHSDIVFKTFSFTELSLDQLYEILALRSEVFIVEQDCPYQDLDGKDQRSEHLCAYEGERLVAYARLVRPGVSYEEPSIGRVITSEKIRSKGVGKELMQQAIDEMQRLYPNQDIRISAQSYLEAFYSGLGFHNTGKFYLEDGIPHQEMLFSR